MSPYALHPLPSRRAVVREQLRAVGLSLRREGLAMGGLLAAFTLFAAWIAVQGASPRIPFVPQAAAPLLLVALLLPMAVWKGEDPSRRLYHWAMPVAHGEHALAKVFSGWTWMMAAMAAYFVWVLGMALATGGEIGVQSTAQYISHEHHVREFAVAPWRWVVPFAGATVLYLFGSALVLATRFPVRWLGGGVVGVMFLSALPMHGQPNPVAHFVRWVWRAPMGLRTALTGDQPGLTHVADMVLVSPGPSFGAWMLAVWLWMALALTLFLFASYRQPQA